MRCNPHRVVGALGHALLNREVFIAYAQGGGGLYIRANKRAFKLIDAHPGVGITNRFGIPDVPERVHWEEDFALEVGPPGAYDFGTYTRPRRHPGSLVRAPMRARRSRAAA